MSTERFANARGQGVQMQVLLVEAEAPLVRLMAWFLTEAGFAVAKVDPSRGDLVKSIIEFDPEVVVFNSGLSPDEKRACIEALHAADARPKILDVSSYEEYGKQPDSGADAYLRLPFHADDLVTAVRDLAGDDDTGP